MNFSELLRLPCLQKFELFNCDYRDGVVESVTSLPDGKAIVMTNAPIAVHMKPDTGSYLELPFGADVGVILFDLSETDRAQLDCAHRHESGVQRSPILLAPEGEVAAHIACELQNGIIRSLQQRLDHITQVSNRFSFLSLELSGIDTIISYFKEVIGNPIAVYDEYFAPIATTDEYVLHYQEIPGTAEQIYLHNIHFLKRRVRFLSGCAPRQESVRMLFPIVLEKQSRAYLAVFEVNTPMEAGDATIFEISATAVIVAMKRRIALQSIEEKYINDFIYDLIYRKDNQQQELQRRAEILGISEQSGYLVAAIDINFTDPSFKAENTDPYGGIHDRILNTIITFVNSPAKSALVTKFGKSFLVIHKVTDDSSCAQEKIKARIEALREQLDEKFPAIAFYIGIGRKVENIYSISKSYKEAVAAISFGAAVHDEGDTFLVSYDDSSLLKIFSKVNDRNLVYEIIPESLVALQAHDKQNRTNLYETLSVYLDCNCNATKASGRLFIHYKTMLYRLEKIEHEFMINVENRSSRIQIELGIEMLNMLHYQ